MSDDGTATSSKKRKLKKKEEKDETKDDTNHNNTNDDDDYVDDEEDDGYNPWTGIKFSNKYYSILKTRMKLPVYQFKKELISKVLKNQCVVVEGETGTYDFLFFF